MNGGVPLWSHDTYVFADLYDAVTANTWVLSNREVPRHDRSKFPEPYPRPGIAPKKSVTAEALIAHRERTRRR